MADSECRSDCGSIGLEDSLHKAHAISDFLQHISYQCAENDRRFHQEVQAHAVAREQLRVFEEDATVAKASVDTETREHQAAKAKLAQTERFQAKSEAAMKAMRDDFQAVKTENEALRAEMDVQRKAFAVAVNWESAHAKLKDKHDAAARERVQLRNTHLQTQQALEQAVEQQESCKAARTQVLAALERARQDLQKGEDLLTCTALSEEIQAQLGEVDGLKARLCYSEELRRRQREKARVAMEKSLMANATTMLGTSFHAWERVAKEMMLAKAKKEQNKAVAMRGIANSATAIQNFCLTAWAKQAEERRQEALLLMNQEMCKKQKSATENVEKARRKALAQLEKQLVNHETGLVRETYAAWQLLRADRLKKEKAKSIAARNIASSGEALVLQVFQGWSNVLGRAKANRERKAAGQARAMRMIASGDNALLDFCLTQWARLTKDALVTKRAKDGGHKKALRMIASSQEAMQARVIASWANLKKAMNDRDKKMKAVERSLISSGAALVQYVFQNWRQYYEKSKKRSANKASSMRQGLKFVQRREEAMVSKTFSAWGAFRRKACYLTLLEELEKKRNTPALPHENQLKNEAEAKELRAELGCAKPNYQDLVAMLESKAGKLEEVERQIELTNKQVAKASADLVESRRKAKSINEELARVGTFLLSRPSKAPSRPISGKKGEIAHLPRIDRMPLTAREHRPDSASKVRPESASRVRPESTKKDCWLEVEDATI
mmetsp:Transcript_101789/g.287105  ORF Transcript_101789/g.287105 Transcript_101789/m.287105 type:complete len:729 (+) Transcript_101789:200-2386(+)